MDAGLPDVNSPNVRLVIATPEEQMLQVRSNSAQWHGPLTVEEYVECQQLLLDQDLSRAGGLTPWVLVHQPNPTAKRLILCGCETVKKRAFWAHQGQVEEVICHGIYSVFCSAENRGKGYASRMMSDLAQRLKDSQHKDRPVSFSFLVSGIGKKFYARNGWQAFPSIHIALTPSISAPDTPDFKYLAREDISTLCSDDEKLLRQRLISLSHGSSKVVAVIPDAKTMNWNHNRDDFITTALFGKVPVNRGAIAEFGSARAWCYWQHDFASKNELDKGNKLFILHLVVDTKDDPAWTSDSTEQTSSKHSEAIQAIAAVFRAARNEAATWKMSCVEIWDPASNVVAAVQLLDPGIDIVEREEKDIISLQWHGDSPWQDLDWICKERFIW